MRKAKLEQPSRRRRGFTMIWVCCSLVVMLGFASFGVDVAHVQVVNMQLQRAADSGAHAGAYGLLTSTNVANTNAGAAAEDNTVDGSAITSGNVTISYVNWTSSSNYTVLSAANAYQANAIKVTVTYNVPLTFSRLFGVTQHTATRSAIGLLNSTSYTSYDYCTGNPWLAGEPTGTYASQPDPAWKVNGQNPEHPWEYDVAGTPGTTAADGEQNCSPLPVNMTLIPGAALSITGVSGSGSNDFVDCMPPPYNAQGVAFGSIANYDDAASGGVSEHGIADATMPLNSMNAVFLTNSLPDNISTPPPPLDFSTQAERDYTSITPKTQQVFYVGNGQTSTSVQQTIVVPNNATRLFMGTMDGWEWSNNAGGYTFTITQKWVSLVQ